MVRVLETTIRRVTSKESKERRMVESPEREREGESRETSRAAHYSTSEVKPFDFREDSKLSLSLEEGGGIYFSSFPKSLSI